MTDGPCLLATTEILTSDRGIEAAERITAHQQIFTPGGWSSVVDCVFRGIRGTHTIRTHYGFTITVASDTPIPVAHAGDFVLTPASALGPGQTVVLVLGPGTPRAQIQRLEPTAHMWARSKPIHIPTALTPDFCYFLGCVAGNGHENSAAAHGRYSAQGKDRLAGGTVRMTINQDLPGLADQYRKIVRDLFGNVLREIPEASKGVLNIDISRVALLQALHDNGLSKVSTYSVAIPEKVRRGPDQCVAAYIAGVFNTDCEIHKRGPIGISTTSVNLARGVHSELMRLGVVMRLSWHDPEPPHARAYFIMTVGRSSQRAFLDVIEPYCQRPVDWLPRGDHVQSPLTARNLDFSTYAYRYVPRGSRFLSLQTLERLAQDTGRAPLRSLTTFVADEIVEVFPSGPQETIGLVTEQCSSLWAGGIWVGPDDPYRFLPRPIVGRRRSRV